ncbi:Translin [Chaetomium fimeti]|uniref:Translin n=1 Tax=Chaetomium fimeti TaxID=1854472 RepID=A0AAE0H520_9PEZI|nr:Translin [Chaetomium fimeti]
MSRPHLSEKRSPGVNVEEYNTYLNHRIDWGSLVFTAHVCSQLPETIPTSTSNCLHYRAPPRKHQASNKHTHLSKIASEMAPPMIDPTLFDELKTKIEEDTSVRKDLDQILDDLNQQVSFTQGVLSRIHSTPRSKYATLLGQIEGGIRKEIETVGKLSAFASQYPYYKYNHKWTRMVQDAVSTVIICAWLGGMSTDSKPGEIGRLLTLEDIGQAFNVPVNLKDRDAFHITIEEYLLGLITVIDDLSRLAVNSVTLGDTSMAVKISGFIKDLHAGFQVLNLKNDILRKRVDSIKYAVKKVEDVCTICRCEIPAQEPRVRVFRWPRTLGV